MLYWHVAYYMFKYFFFPKMINLTFQIFNPLNQSINEMLKEE